MLKTTKGIFHRCTPAKLHVVVRQHAAYKKGRQISGILMCGKWGFPHFPHIKTPKFGVKSFNEKVNTRLTSTTVILRRPCSLIIDAYIRSTAYLYVYLLTHS